MYSFKLYKEHDVTLYILLSVFSCWFILQREIETKRFRHFRLIAGMER